MYHVVLNTETTLTSFANYSAKGHATRALNTARNTGKIKGRNYRPDTFANAEVMTSEELAAADVEVETTNLMSGATCMIRKSQKGGCCDPGSETYWTM